MMEQPINSSGFNCRQAVLVAIVAILAGVMLAESGGPVAAQQPPAPPPRILAQVGIWQIADPSFIALPGATAYSGVLEGAPYRIEIPDNWNGALVMYAHGWRFDSKVLTVSNPALREHFIASGFAWAASGFQQNGFTPDVGMLNTIALREYFSRRFRQPTRTYVDGQSLGGYIIVASLEQHPGVYDGALSECGVLMQEQRADYLAAVTDLADWLAGANAINSETPEAFTNEVLTKIVPALGTPDNWTAKGRIFESVIGNLSGGPRPFWQQGLADFYTNWFPKTYGPLGLSPSSIAGRAATDGYFTFHADANVAVSDADLNAQIPRKVADPLFRDAETNPTYVLPTGRISAPLLTYHTTGDHNAPLLMEINYRKLVEAAGHGDLLVQRAVRAPNHCQFQPEDLAQGFDDLVSWVERGVKPVGDDFLATNLREIGREWTHKILPGDD